MPDWTASMQQTFEYYIVDPGTWKDKQKLDTVISSSINRDSEAETLGSASISITGSLDECYVRIYLITIQNGITEKFPLGTFLVQTPSITFDGKIETVTLDAYTPLIELKEKNPPIGYSLFKNDNVMSKAYQLVSENLRAPVVEPKSETNLYYDFVAETNDTWLSYITDLISNAKHEFSLDEIGRVLFSPKQDTASLQPVYTYDDGNSSILYSDITTERDLYGIPNVVEVIYSKDSDNYYARVENNDENSPISTVNRGREIVHRVTDPNLIGDPTNNQIQEYAEKLLREFSSLEYTVTYKHGYCPVRVGDCVRLNYSRAGMNNVKAKVISQTITCEPGCPVEEKAIFTIKV